MSPKSTIQKTALVTGASLGIGLELARLAAKDHGRVILVARSEAKLATLAKELAAAHGTEVHVIAADLSLPGAADRLYNDVVALGLAVDTLVNNAGVGQYGRFLEVDAAADARMLQLNMVALTELTRLFARDMTRTGGGRILNIASTAAFQPGPLMSTYYASKAFVLSFSEALANELKDQGVTVTALCPGPTRSGFQDQAQMQGSRLLRLGMMESAAVAAIGYRGMLRGKTVVVAGASNAFLVQSLRFMPRCLVTKVSRFVSERAA